MPAISTTTTRAEKVKPARKKRAKVRVPKAPDRQPEPKAKVKTPDQADRDRDRVAAGRTPDQADRSRTVKVKASDKRAVDQGIERIKAEVPKTMRVPMKGAHVTKEADGKFKVHVTDEKAYKADTLNRIRAKAAPGSFAQAPVLKVLEQTTRVNHAVAGAADAAVTHKNVLHAAKRGIQNKDKTTFSDVLGHAGVKNKAVRGAVGFGLDVALDPTTYLTLGTAPVATKVAAGAAKAAEKKALAKGLTTEQAKKFGERAGKQAERKGDQTAGATVKFAGKELPGVRKATAKASKPARAAGRKVTPRKVREGVRGVAADLNPDVVPAGVSKVTSRKAVQATRTARSKASRGTHEAQQHALGIKKRIGEARYSQVIDAIENGTIGKLPEDLREVAVRVRSQFRHANRQRKHAGIRGGTVGGKNTRGGVKEYIPHNLTDQAKATLGHETGGKGSGRKVIRPSSSQGRTAERAAPLSTLREKFPDQYSEDLPNLYANHKGEAATSVARAELNRRIGDLGKPVRKGDELNLAPNEGVYHITGSDISNKLKDADVQRLLDKGSHSGPMKGRYVVLNDDIVKRAIEGVTPTERTAIGAGYDKVQSGVKRIALATPGFHVRNAVGDTQNAYLGQAGHKLPRNMVQAGRVLKAEGRRDKALKGMAPAEGKAGTIKTGRYGPVTYDKAAEELGKHGAMRSGYVGRELPELSGEAARLPRVRLPRRAKQALLNREDLPRLTTAIEALKQGATWEEAAQKVADYHFDYAHLTKFERTTARRVLPFYTFTARNIPRQFKSLATHPGKFANYQKLIESASKATGMDEEANKHRDQVKQLEAAGVKVPDGWQAQLSEWEQRNAGLPISWRGHKFTVSFGLPLASGLNEVPGAAGKKQLDEYFQTAMALVSPLIKDPVEYFDNYSFFFRNQLESDTSPLVSAPSYVRVLPKGTRDDLGITQGLDKRTGKTIWRWPGKVDYIVKVVPGMPQYAQSLATEGTNRRGKGTGGKVLQVFGVRAEPFDPDKTITNLAYDRVGEIQKRQAALRQSVNPANGFPVSAENPTREYVKLMGQLKVAQAVAYGGQARQGYKVLPKAGAPAKVKPVSGKVTLGGGAGPKVRFGGSSGPKVKFGG